MNEIIITVWFLSGAVSWMMFGLTARDPQFDPFEKWEFYCIFLPLLLLIPVAGFLAALVVSIDNWDKLQ